jgi:hypothetical protein
VSILVIKSPSSPFYIFIMSGNKVFANEAEDVCQTSFRSAGMVRMRY